jgi:transcription antitermination factor NusG
MKTFTVAELNNNYSLQMTSKKEKIVRSRIEIYFAELEITDQFEVVSTNRYQPFVLPWPFGNFNKKIKKNLLQKAAKEADKQNGDAIVIVDNTHFKVIRFL